MQERLNGAEASRKHGPPWHGLRRHGSRRHGRRRVALAYVVLLALVAAVAVVVFQAGRHERPARRVAGDYRLDAASPCLGDRGQHFELRQSGQFVSLDGPRAPQGKRPGQVAGKLRVEGDRVEGDRVEGAVTCRDGRRTGLTLRATGPAALGGSVAGTAVTATRVGGEAGPAPPGRGRPPSAEETFGQLMLAVAAVILAARLVGAAVRRIGQPSVMGEVLAGILLGPTLVRTVAPGLSNLLFPDFVIPLLRAAANIGLAFYMFLVGLELDPRILRGRVEQAALISHASIAIPMSLGIAVALPLYELIGPDTSFVPFALFMGVAMSITAFPVLARILLERRMLKRPVGAIAMGAAAVDDVTAWGLLALSTAVAGTGSGLVVVRVVALAAVFCATMVLIGRPLLARVSDAYDEAGRVPAGWIAAIFVGVLLSSFVTQRIGIAAIFGAFVMGLIMPRRADLTHDVTRRVEDFVVTVLLPLFFVVTGLRVQVGLLDRPELWLLALVLLLVAIAGKWLGAMGAARFTGFSLRESAAVGALMNTRGLTELIVLNIGLELGVVSPALFTMLVIMALVTTFMTGPALRLIDPRGELGARPEDELRAAAEPETEPPPARAILVAPQDERNVDWLLALATPLASSRPARELILARLLVPSRAATGVAAEDRELARTVDDLHRRRAGLVAAGLATRVVAFTSVDPGEDLVRLTSQEDVDLLLVDGRRPLVGEGVPRGSVGAVLLRAPCDVAVLVDREHRAFEIGSEHAVLVPFGGAEHDWAALELGAWIASARGAPVRLLGAASDLAEGRRDASRLLGNASLVLQQLAGIAAEPLLIEPGRAGVVRAAEGAGLLVIGLSERWRDEGLGPVRSEIARTAPAPTLFVRRGARPGALAPRTDLTRFAWSEAGPGRPG
ncbi:MAG TPA: cation:proton antiporter [Actinomycetes bacterium]|nr:cation:proton antiporter [Actinomycetes bacterium]